VEIARQIPIKLLSGRIANLVKRIHSDYGVPIGSLSIELGVPHPFLRAHYDGVRDVLSFAEEEPPDWVVAHEAGHRVHHFLAGRIPFGDELCHVGEPSCEAFAQMVQKRYVPYPTEYTWGKEEEVEREETIEGGNDWLKILIIFGFIGLALYLMRRSLA